MFGSLWPAFPWSGQIVFLAPCVSRKVSSSVLKGRLHSERDTATGVTGLRKAQLWWKKKKVATGPEHAQNSRRRPPGTGRGLFHRGQSLENTRPAWAPQASHRRRNQTSGSRISPSPTTHFRSQPHFPVRPPVPVPPLASGLLRFRCGRLFRPL